MLAHTPEDVDRLLCEAISAGDLKAALAFYEPEAHMALIASIWSLTGTGSDGKTINLSGQGQEVVRRQPDGPWQFVIDAPNGLSS